MAARPAARLRLYFVPSVNVDALFRRCEHGDRKYQLLANLSVRRAVATESMTPLSPV
jgi:hypothetical protein